MINLSYPNTISKLKEGQAIPDQMISNQSCAKIAVLTKHNLCHNQEKRAKINWTRIELMTE